ncbi:MAG TPA: SLATT domain-containing protein [Propionibacteriaceae bacterium]|nr:SLATT domain-containing protein [Propionibacteriaceae bacterium]
MSGRLADFRLAYQELRLKDQRLFYSGRAAEYLRAHTQATAVRTILLLLAGMAGIAALLDDSVGYRAAMGVVGALLAALAGALTAFEELMGFDQVAKLYTDAANSLEEAEIEWELQSGEDIPTNVDRVEQIFRTENGQWGQLVLQTAERESLKSSPQGG